MSGVDKGATLAGQALAVPATPASGRDAPRCDPSRWAAFNINHSVRVRLTSGGRDFVRERNENYASMFPGADWPMPDECADGYSQWQLWDLMEVFGGHIAMGVPVPFETTILLDASGMQLSEDGLPAEAEGLQPDPKGTPTP